jgi:uncharacterized RDD family membrane protein YckC
MNTQIGEEQKSKISLNLDEFDIDSYDFKPVTKGLGFHDPLEKSKRVNKPKAQVYGQSRPSVNNKKPSSHHLQNTPTTVSDPSLLTGIDALYGNKTVEEVTKPKVLEKKTSKVKAKAKEATFLQMAGAFILDLLLVFTINIVLFIAFYGFAFKTLSVGGVSAFILNSLPFFAILFSLIFITYFSLLEPMVTWGKRVWGIKSVLIGSKKPITIKSSFIRALISLCSFPLLFFPLMFDFQGKLSDSSVIQD